MANSELLEKSLKAMIFINAASRNLHLYPPASASVINSVGKAYDGIQTVLDLNDSLEFADHEKKLVVCRQSIKESGSEFAQAKVFLTSMQNFSIKSIVFKKGITKDELGSF